ncbi:MAG: TetR/AcrR family transcriptional regulator [Bacteroidales bacterium]|nr:TetR/AcrR family transcriptional regulator [Bacteroidales bacterium]
MSRNKAFNEEIVLEKAMQVFWDNGYEATSVRLLEKEMGINQFSIYATFANKKKLFVESLKKYREYAKINRFNPLLKEGAKLKDLENFLHNFTFAVRLGKNQRGCLVVNTTGELGAKDSEIVDELRNYYSFIKEMILQVLQNSANAGEISGSADLDKYSNYLLGIMQGLSVGAKVLTEKQVEDIVSMALLNIK